MNLWDRFYQWLERHLPDLTAVYDDDPESTQED